MKEQIKEFALQCGAWHQVYDHKSLMVDHKFDVEKFAELIVRECINVLDPNGEYTEKYKHSHIPETDGLRQVLSQEHYFEMLASNKLKNHFGVE
jgi:hypothetical protein